MVEDLQPIGCLRPSAAGSMKEMKEMRRNITLAAGVVVLLIGTLLMAISAEAKPFKSKFSGWGVATEIDNNGDGMKADSTTAQSRGTFGRAITNGQSELAPVPSGTCDGNPAIVQYDYVSSSTINVFQNGDLIISLLDHGTLCADFTNPLIPTFTGEIHLVIVGGTGRFEGATGWLTSISEWVAVNGEPGVRFTHTAFWGTMEGEIFVAH